MKCPVCELRSDKLDPIVNSFTLGMVMVSVFGLEQTMTTLCEPCARLVIAMMETQTVVMRAEKKKRAGAA